MRKSIIAFCLLLAGCYTDYTPELGKDTIEVLNKRTQEVVKTIPNVFKARINNDFDHVSVFVLDIEQDSLYLVYEFRLEFFDWRWAAARPEPKRWEDR